MASGAVPLAAAAAASSSGLWHDGTRADGIDTSAAHSEAEDWTHFTGAEYDDEVEKEWRDVKRKHVIEAAAQVNDQVTDQVIDQVIDQVNDQVNDQVRASNLQKTHKKKQSVNDKRFINALQLEGSAPPTARFAGARFDPARAPLRTEPRVKKNPPVDPNETTEEMVQRVQGHRDVHADPRVQDDGTNLTGERGAQRYAEQRAAVSWASVRPTRDAGSPERSDDTPERPRVGDIRKGTIAERTRATNLANVQREQERLVQQRRIEARDAQRVLDHQETERANAQYEREKWAMTAAAWHVNNGIDAAERRVATQVAQQDALDLSNTPWRQARETFDREMQEATEMADAANSLAEDARRNLQNAPRLAAERDAHMREVAHLREIGQETEARIREERRLHDIDSRQLQRWRLQAGYQHPSPAVAQDGWDWWNRPNTGWATSSWQTPWNPDDHWQADGDWWTPTAGDHAGLYHAASVHPAVVPAKGKGKCKGATYQPALQPPRGDHTARLDP